MLNIFINSSIYGQSIGSTFNFSQAVIGKPLSSRRLTPNAYANIIAPIYERQIDMEKITMLYKSGQIDKVNKLNRGVYSENIRVNSLYVLIRDALISLITAFSGCNSNKTAPPPIKGS